MTRYRQRSFVMSFFLWTLVIGPALVVAYIALWIPVQYWPVGSGTPQESIISYVAPMVPAIWFPGSILGGILFVVKGFISS
ncbi:MAG: hypothetical protein ACFFCW_13575 [Candidatus Hodarchaeota archaeon]